MTVSGFVLLLLLLGVISLCLVVLTAAFLVALKDLRRTLQQLQSGLPACTRAFQELHSTLGALRHLLNCTQRAGQHAEEIFHKTCDAAVDAIEPFVAFGERVRSILAQRFGNGARAKPRRVVKS